MVSTVKERDFSRNLEEDDGTVVEMLVGGVTGNAGSYRREGLGGGLWMPLKPF